MVKTVIYTCLVGNYDSLLQPKVVDDGFDYICFSNDIKEPQVGIWSIRPIPFEHKDKTRLSRYVKLNPHKALAEYEYSIWVDANIEIIDDTLYERLKLMIESDVLIAQVQHTFCDCIYKDLYNCMYYARDKVSVLMEQYNFLKANKYPEENGLYENNLIFRKHLNEKVIKISEEWWELFMRFSKRDQLSLNYIYWVNDFIPDLFLPKGGNTRNCKGFMYHQHNTSLMKRVIAKYKFLRNRILLKKLGVNNSFNK